MFLQYFDRPTVG